MKSIKQKKLSNTWWFCSHVGKGVRGTTSHWLMTTTSVFNQTSVCLEGARAGTIGEAIVWSELKWNFNFSTGSQTHPVVSLCSPAVPLCSAVNPHILQPDPGPLCRGTRWTADRGPNIPERLCSPGGQRRLYGMCWAGDTAASSSGRELGELRERASLDATAVPNGRRAWKESAPWTRTGRRAPRPRRYKTEAPGSPKTLREAGGRRVPLQSSSNKVPV